MKPPAPTVPNCHEFREAWLRMATMELRPYFASAGYTVPENIRFAIAFTSTGRRAIDAANRGMPRRLQTTTTRFSSAPTSPIHLMCSVC